MTQTVAESETVHVDAVGSLGRRRRSPVANALRLVGPPLVLFVAVAALWYAARPVFGVPKYLLPTPGETWEALNSDWSVLWSHARITLGTAVIGFTISAVVGIGLGIMVVLSPLFARSVYPYVIASQTFPKMALAPILVVWLGLGLAPKVAMASLVTFFPIVVATIVGLNSVNPDELLLARSMGVKKSGVLTKIRLPAALPSIFGGLKVAGNLALVGAVVGEFIASSRGLGYQLTVAMSSLNTARLFAALIVLAVSGIIVYCLIGACEYLFLPWRRHRKQRPVTVTEQ